MTLDGSWPVTWHYNEAMGLIQGVLGLANWAYSREPPLKSLRLDNTAYTPHLAWSALATIVTVLGVAMAVGTLAGRNAGVLSGIGAAVLAMIAWCAAFLLRKPTTDRPQL